MKKTRFKEPYNAKGRPNFTRRSPGVYIIKENDIIVYIGFSGYSVYKTMYRHFQAWNHPSQPVTSYKNKINRYKYTVRVVYTTPTKASALESALILKYLPRDNQNKIPIKSTKNTEKIISEYINCPF